MTHFQVGFGVAQAMAEMGDVAVQNSAFEHPWPGALIEKGYGRDNAYFWDNLIGEPRLVIHPTGVGVNGLIDAIDVSSHQERDLTRYVALAGADHVIVRMYQGLESPPREHSIDQVASARALDCSVGTYGWLYTQINPRGQVNDQLLTASLADVLPPPVLWQDIEHYQGRLPIASEIDAALDECAKQGVRGGIYSRKGVWDEIGNPNFPGVPLWVADYDGIPTLESTEPFGEMTLVAKQYTSTAPDGSGLDRNVILAQYTEV